ncbi:MAG: T9SS type A sorting domain-containing protein [Ignavibacteriales bacterium]|nr:T9SS type A sorting domain-containing protein [Ignavibacteriales bacterium]
MFRWTLLGLFLVTTLSAIQAQSTWTPLAGNPVIGVYFDIGATEIYDPCVIKEGTLYRMWYTRKVAGIEKIGYATSADGIAWTRVDTAVIIPSTDLSRFDSKKVGQPAVIRDGDTLKMWYWGDGPNVGNIGLAVSTDGRTWTKVNGPNADKSVFDRTKDATGSLALVFPSVIKDGSTYKMWYGHFVVEGSIMPYRIAYATSPNGINWTPVTGSGKSGCVIDIGAAGSFDASMAGFPSVVKNVTGVYEMWYAGSENSGVNVHVGYATSADGITWTKSAGTAGKGSVIDIAGPPAVIKDGNAYKLWATPNTYSINYYTSGTTSVPAQRTQPFTFSLEQNYPNPFNPSTAISFTLPQTSQVRMTVFTILGKEIATLVDGTLSAGTHETIWDAGTHSSGVYMYRLQTPTMTECRKMTLVR